MMKKIFIIVLMISLNIYAKQVFSVINESGLNNYKGYAKGLYFQIDTTKYINKNLNDNEKIKLKNKDVKSICSNKEFDLYFNLGGVMNIYLAKDEAVFVFIDGCDTKATQNVRSIALSQKSTYMGQIGNMIFTIFYNEDIRDAYIKQNIANLAKKEQQPFFLKVNKSFTEGIGQMNQLMCKEKTTKNLIDKKISFMTIFTGVPKKAYVSLLSKCTQ